MEERDHDAERGDCGQEEEDEDFDQPRIKKKELTPERVVVACGAWLWTRCEESDMEQRTVLK